VLGVTNVFSLPLNVFHKSAICPRSEDLLAFGGSGVNLARRAMIESHLDHCDFCRAELQLLRYYRPQPELTPTVRIPVGLKRLAECLLPKCRSWQPRAPAD
jgi:hypothetical protein